MAPNHLLKTSRLLLCPLVPDHLEALHALWCDPLVRKFLWDDIIIPQEAAREIIAGSIASFEQHGFGLWNILSQTAQQNLGFCGLRFIAETCDVEILYGLWPEFWKKGFATEAAREVLRFGFQNCTLNRILAGTEPPNTASLAVMERLGMRYDCEIRSNNLEMVYYAITNKAWQTLTPDAFVQS